MTDPTIKAEPTEKNNTREHIAETANSIYASWNSFPVEGIDFIPFFDNLKNLIQEKVIHAFFEFNDAKEPKLLFHTFKDPYFEDIDKTVKRFAMDAASHPSAEWKIRLQPEENIYLISMKFSFQPPDEKADEVGKKSKLILVPMMLKKENYGELKQVLLAIKNDYPSILPAVTQYIRKVAENPTDIFRQPIKRLIEPNFELNKQKYLDEIRELMGECIGDIEHASLIESRSAKNPDFVFPNLFAVIAYPAKEKRCNVFNYTAQILLTKNQIGKIEDFINKPDFVKMLETPLSNSARSIADTSFCTGLVEYDGTAGDERDSIGNGTDKQRRIYEGQLYELVLQRKHNVNFIPIFLSGCPWLVFFTLSKPEDRSLTAWRHKNFIYRDLLSKVGTSIRIKAKDRYFKIIANIIEETYGRFKNEEFNSISQSLDDYIKEIDRQFMQLRCFFPFNTPILNRSFNEESSYFNLKNIEVHSYKTSENEFWHYYLEYDSLADHALILMTKEVIKNLINRTESENKRNELSVAAYGSAHFYGNWLSEVNKDVTQTKNLINKLKDKFNDSDSHSLLKSSISDISAATRKMEGVTRIVDLLAKRLIDENSSPMDILLNDKRFYTTVPVDLSGILRETLKSMDITSKVEIPDTTVLLTPLAQEKRPASTFYENIFLEILTNYRKQSTGKLTIEDIVEDGKIIGMTFTNSAACNIGEKSVSVPKEINRHSFKGAILYCHLFLKEYSLGKIEYQKLCNEKTGVFILRLMLNFIEYGQ